MLETLRANAGGWGWRSSTVPTDAEHLPFGDESFDLVLGHAVLHHIPDLPRAFAEFERVLAPGGTLLFAGSPRAMATAWRACPSASPALLAPAMALRDRGAPRLPPDADGSDGRAGGRRRRPRVRSSGALADRARSRPARCARHRRGAPGQLVRMDQPHARGHRRPRQVPWAWRCFAYRGYLLLQSLDRRLLESRLPAAIFYNLMLAARKPAA